MAPPSHPADTAPKSFLARGKSDVECEREGAYANVSSLTNLRQSMGTSYLCPLAPCISNVARRCSTSPFVHPTAIWSPAQSNTLMLPGARKKATGAEFFAPADPFSSFSSSSSCTSTRSPSAVMTFLPTCCFLPVPFENENSPTTDACTSVPSLMFQKRVFPHSSTETTILLLRNSTRVTGLLRTVSRLSSVVVIHSR